MKYTFRNFLTGMVVAIAALSMSVPTFAQDENANNPEDYVPVIAYFNLGDVVTYHEIRSKFKITDGDTAVTYHCEFNYSFEVVDSTETSYTIKYLPGEILGLDDQNNLNAFLAAGNDYMPAELLFTTDECGAITHILNWEKVSQAMSKGVEALLNKLPGEQAQKLKNNSIFNFNSEEAVMKRFTPAVIHFALHGNAYKLGMTESTDDTNGVKSFIQTYAEYLDEDEAVYEGDYRVVSKTQSEIPSELAMKIAAPLLKEAMGSEKDWENVEKEMSKVSKIDITQLQAWDFFFSGWPNVVYRSKSSKYLNSETLEITNIECLKGDW